jgi:hypothetical protein
MNNAHILGTERIGKLLVQYSIPAIIGMTITSLYNIIDSIFIGHGVGPMGIAGLAITFPLMNLVVAFCTMVSAGGLHHFVHPVGTERPGRSNGSIGKHTDVLPGQRIHIRQCFIHLSG